KSGEAFRELDAIVYPAVQPQAADRVIDMCRVAGEQDTALAESRCHALVHLIEIAVDNRIWRRRGKEALQPRLHARVAQRSLVGLFRPGGKHDAPLAYAVLARDLEEICPLLRIGQVVAVAIAALALEIEPGGEDNEALRPGVPLELDAKQLAHGAAPPVR